MNKKKLTNIRYELMTFALTNHRLKVYAILEVKIDKTSWQVVFNKVEISSPLYGPIQIDVEARSAREPLRLVQLARILERLGKVNQIVS